MKILIAVAVSLLVVGVAKADLDASMDEMCTKMKTCAIDNAKQQGLPAEMEQMMVGMFDGLCKSMMQPYADSIGKAGLENKAEACVDSIVEESCEKLMASKGEHQTKECDEFKKAADEAGIDVN